MPRSADSRAGHALAVGLPLIGGVAVALWASSAPSPATPLPYSPSLAGTARSQPTPVASSASLAATTAADVQEVVAAYCVACHNQTLSNGGLALDAIDFDDPGAFAEPIERMIRRLRAGTMPPAGVPRPELPVYDSVASWLEAELDRAWAAAPVPGRAVPVHRLNRTEYNNAVNDLLGLDVDVRSLLPGDPTADGSFDNMAAALPFSTAHLERYLSVARRVTRMAVGLPPTNPEVATYEIPLHVLQDWRQDEDLPLGSRGGIAVRHHFPADGEYLVRIRLRANWQDYIMGMGWPQQLEVRLDGRLVERFVVGGDAPGTPAPMSFTGPGEPADIEWEEYMLTEDERLEVRIPAQAGPHTVGVSYVREHLEPEDIPQPQQRGRLLANDEVYMDYQQVQSVEIGGPYGPAQIALDTPSRRVIFTCHPSRGAPEAECATEILSQKAREAYRRPVGEGDLRPLLEFFERGRREGGTFDAGIQFALELLLSDPEFLVRVYEQPEGLAPGDVYPLSDLEVASRLSFFLWSSVPDEPLLRVAEEGSLTDPEVLEAQVRRMLDDPRTTETLVGDFAAQWLNLRRIDEVVVDPELYPNFDESLLEAFERETELFLADAIEQDRSVLELLSAEHTYVNERLAQHYGVPGIYGSRFRRVNLPDLEQRGGLLAHGGLLAVTSYPSRTSPVLRGKWLLDNVLGTPPPPPLPNVAQLEEPTGGEVPASMRERLARHRTDPTCATCHSVIDPLGFALESFDVIGGWRDTDERGTPVDTRWESPAGAELEGFGDLRYWLLDRPERFVHALTEKLMAYALGRRIEYYDQPSVREIVRTAAEEDYSWSALILGIVRSPAFLMSSA